MNSRTRRQIRRYARTRRTVREIVASVDRLALAADQEAERLRRDPYDVIPFIDFIRQAWPVLEGARPFVENWHIEQLAAAGERIARGEIRRAAVNVPPGFMKSLLFSVLLPAWIWTIPEDHPDYRFNVSSTIINAAHSMRLSLRDAVKMRKLLRSGWYKATFPTCELVAGEDSKGKYSNTAGGERLATSTGADTTGFRGDLLIADDLISARKASYKKQLEACSDWAREEWHSRVNDAEESAQMYIGQRLAKGDVFGTIRKGLLGSGWHWAIVTGEFDPTISPPENSLIVDPRTHEGEPAFPERYSSDYIDEQKIVLGPTRYGYQWQQKETAGAGRIFPASNWVRMPLHRFPARFEEVIVSMDCSFKDTASQSSKEGSEVAIHVWGRSGPNAFILDAVGKFCGFQESLTMLRSIIKRWKSIGIHRILIEDAANGPAIIDTIKSQVPGVIPTQPKGSKVDRAWSVEGFFWARNVVAPTPETALYAEKVISQAEAFPDDDLDDHVDAMTQAVHHLLAKMYSAGLSGTKVAAR